MNGKKNHSQVNYNLINNTAEKNYQKDTRNYKKLSLLYYRYLEYNPELEQVLNQKKINAKHYLQFLVTVLNKVNTERN